MEAVVKGVYYYFVASERDLRRSGGASDCWRELPSVTAEQIRKSREMKKLLTGRWDAHVEGFPGCEINLVRALIARISCNTVIAPDGYFSVSEEGAIVKSEGEFDPSSVDLSSIESWRHAREYIYPSGLTTLPEEGAGEGVEAVDKLAAISASNFSVKVTGDKGVYSFPEGSRSYAVTVLKSKKWPGAVTVASKSTWVSIYVGYGLENGGKLMPVEIPSAIQQEPAELTEQPEPYPLEDDTAKPVPDDEQE
ncbi:MAG: hypothetical protein EBZ48_18085 [Proteobacteria bacterium]|nr:hypothetical protein [Pseudomonadota bacterium]